MAGSRIAVLLLCSLVAFPVVAKDVEGTQVPDTVTLDGKTLRIIGAGIRNKWFFNVYVGALYAEKPTFNAANLIKSEQVKRMDLHLLRDVGKDKIVESIREGFEKQSKDQMPALQGRLDQLAGRGTGSQEGATRSRSATSRRKAWCSVGRRRKPSSRKDFADALFSVWLGPDPVDSDLKRKLLGG
jgi:hypothetical protein